MRHNNIGGKKLGKTMFQRNDCGGGEFLLIFDFFFVKSRMLLRGSLSPVGTEVELMWHFILV